MTQIGIKPPNYSSFYEKTCQHSRLDVGYLFALARQVLLKMVVISFMDSGEALALPSGPILPNHL